MAQGTPELCLLPKQCRKNRLKPNEWSDWFLRPGRCLAQPEPSKHSSTKVRVAMTKDDYTGHPSETIWISDGDQTAMACQDPHGALEYPHQPLVLQQCSPLGQGVVGYRKSTHPKWIESAPQRSCASSVEVDLVPDRVVTVTKRKESPALHLVLPEACICESASVLFYIFALFFLDGSDI